MEVRTDAPKLWVNCIVSFVNRRTMSPHTDPADHGLGLEYAGSGIGASVEPTESCAIYEMFWATSREALRKQ